MVTLKNNEGTIVRPRGRPVTSFSVVPDLMLADTSLSLSARLVLVYIGGRPPHWVATVADIRSTLGISGTTWQRLRDELRCVDIVPRNHPRRLGGGRNQFTWVLDVDLSRYYLSTGPSPILGDGSHRPPSIDGERVITNTNESREDHHHRARLRAAGVGGGGLGRQDSEGGHVEDTDPVGLRAWVLDLGLTEQEAARFARAAGGASSSQLALLRELLPGALSKARGRAAMSIHLAKLAAAGLLESPQRSAPTDKVAVETAQRRPEQEAQARLAKWSGRRLFHPASGQSWSIDPGGLLRGEAGIEHPSDAVALLLRLDAGLLELR